MNRWDPLWLLLSLSVSAGVNEMTKARFEYALGSAERTAATGSLELEHDTTHHKLDLATVQVVAGPAARIWGAPLTVRELWLFSAEADAKSEPDLQVFFDFGGAIPPIDVNARSADVLVGRELAALPAGLGSPMQSRLRLPAAPTAWAVSGGTLFIREAVPVAATEEGSSWRIEGDVKLLVRGEHAEQRLQGKFQALLAWR